MPGAITVHTLACRACRRGARQLVALRRCGAAEGGRARVGHCRRQGGPVGREAGATPSPTARWGGAVVAGGQVEAAERSCRGGERRPACPRWAPAAPAARAALQPGSLPTRLRVLRRVRSGPEELPRRRAARAAELSTFGCTSSARFPDRQVQPAAPPAPPPLSPPPPRLPAGFWLGPGTPGGASVPARSLEAGPG